MDIGILIGRIISLLIFPVLVLAVIGLVQYVRTKDKNIAKKSMFSAKSIGFSLIVLLMGIMGQTNA